VDQVWIVEVSFLEEAQKVELRRFMEGKGYSKSRYWERSFDAIFVHESFHPNSSDAGTSIKNLAKN